MNLSCVHLGDSFLKKHLLGKVVLGSKIIRVNRLCLQIQIASAGIVGCFRLSASSNWLAENYFRSWKIFGVVHQNCLMDFWFLKNLKLWRIVTNHDTGLRYEISYPFSALIGF